jgi:hypothetical protein
MIGIDNKQNSDGKEKAVENTVIQERLAALRKVMEEKQVNWCLFVTSDPHGSEYINACYESRRFFSGFTGSNGDLLVGLSEALLWTDGTLLQAPIIDIPDVVDPVGVGDAFMAGLLHAITTFPDDKQLQLNYSLAASALKNTVPGDFNLSSHEEIMDVVSHQRNIHSLYKVTI